MIQADSQSKRFFLFLVGQSLACTGEAFSTVGFPLVILKQTGSVAAMAAATSFAAAGAVVSGLTLGPTVDRVDRRRFMIACDAIRAMVILALPATWWIMGYLPVALLFGFAFVIGLLSNAFELALFALIPELVPSSQLIWANSVLQAAWAAAFAIGPLLAGFAIERWGAAPAMGTTAIAYAASIVSLALMRPRDRAHEPEPNADRRGGRAAGFAFIARTPVLRALALIFVVEIFLAEAITDLLLFTMKSSIQLSDRAVGGVFALVSVVTMVAALLAPAARRKLGIHMAFIVTSFVSMTLVMLASFVTVPALVVIAAMGIGASTRLRNIISLTRRQEITPAALLGRVTAAFWLVLAVPRPLGAAAVGLFAARFGLPTTFRTVAGGLALLAVGTVFVRSLRDGDAESGAR